MTEVIVLYFHLLYTRYSYKQLFNKISRRNLLWSVPLNNLVFFYPKYTYTFTNYYLNFKDCHTENTILLSVFLFREYCLIVCNYVLLYSLTIVFRRLIEFNLINFSQIIYPINVSSSVYHRFGVTYYVLRPQSLYPNSHCLIQ